MVAVLGLSAFVVDYGILWVSRVQAQTAADAAATAGAIARAYDDFDPSPTPGGIVEQSVAHLVTANPVWFAPATKAVTYDCPEDLEPVPFPCVRVDVYRDTGHGNPLPTFFGPVIGILNQSVRATATALVGPGNTTTCLRPWAIPDRWIENRSPAGVFNRYVEGGPNTGSVLSPADNYVAPTSGGMRPDIDVGVRVTLDFADPLGDAPISAGYMLPLALPGGGSYEDNVASCSGRLSVVGEQLPTESSTVLAATATGFSNLIDADSGASWDAGTHSVRDSCAPGSCGAISPRVVAVALYDPEEYQRRRATNNWCSGSRCIRVTNFVGFFIESATGTSATGYITKYPGLVTDDAPILPDYSFLPAITLVR